MLEIAANPTDSGLQRKAENLNKECKNFTAEDVKNCN